MATGTVSSIDADNWQLISSQAMNGLNTHTFSSLSGYKTYWIVAKGLTNSTADNVQIRVNGDTSGASYANMWAADGNGAGFVVTPSAATTRAISFQIDNADKTTPHQVKTNTYASGYPASPGDAYVDPVAITSLTIRTIGSNNFTGGTVYLYGIAS